MPLIYFVIKEGKVAEFCKALESYDRAMEFDVCHRPSDVTRLCGLSADDHHALVRIWSWMALHDVFELNDVRRLLWPKEEA